MSRPVRIEYPGAHYHVTSKGLDNQPVFADNEDRLVFLNVLEGSSMVLELAKLTIITISLFYHKSGSLSEPLGL